MTGGRGGVGEAAERVVHPVQLALPRGQVGGLGVQQFGVGEVVGAVFSRHLGALCGQVLDRVLGGGRVAAPGGGRAAGGQGAGRDREGVKGLLGFLLAPGVRGGGVGADGGPGLGQVRGTRRVKGGDAGVRR